MTPQGRQTQLDSNVIQRKDRKGHDRNRVERNWRVLEMSLALSTPKQAPPRNAVTLSKLCNFCLCLKPIMTMTMTMCKSQSAPVWIWKTSQFKPNQICVQCEKRSWYMKHRERNRKGRETEPTRNMSERELEMRGGKYEGTDLNCAFYHLWRWSECRDYWRRTWPPKGHRFVCRLWRRVQVRSGKSSWQPPASSSDSPPSLHRDTQTQKHWMKPLGLG